MAPNDTVDGATMVAMRDERCHDWRVAVVALIFPDGPI